MICGGFNINFNFNLEEKCWVYWLSKTLLATLPYHWYDLLRHIAQENCMCHEARVVPLIVVLKMLKNVIDLYDFH